MTLSAVVIQRMIFSCSVVLLLLAGCAPTTVKQVEPVFFPPAPNPPRVQFLLGIGDSRDVEGNETEVSLFSMSAVRNEIKGFTKPYGIATQGNKIYVTDTLAGKVAVIDLPQKKFEWLKGDFGPGQLKKPISLATDSDGTLYVADRGRKRIVVFDAEGNFTRVYGEAYDMSPVDVAVDERRVYALDRSRNKILVFNKKNGQLIEGLGQSSENAAENLAVPTVMALSQQGVFYVTNAGNGQIVKLDRDGHVLKTIGKMGDGFGQFGRPRGVAIDDKKRVYVVDAAHQNVQMFNEDDRLLMFFGDPGLIVGSLNIPAGIAVTNENIEFFQQYAAPNFELEQVVLVVNQVGRHRVAIYGVGKKRDFDYEAFYKETVEIQRKADESRAERESKKKK